MSVNPRTKRTAAWAAAGVLGAVAVGAAALSQVGIAAADSASASPSASAPVPGGPRGPGGPGDWHGGPGQGGPGRGGPGHAAEMTAVAKALGITETDLQTQLKAGKSLAAIAKAKGVPLQTVIDAIVAQEKTELAAAVKAGRLTQAQADQMSKDVVARVTAEVNRVPGVGGPGGPGGPGDWRGGPGHDGTGMPGGPGSANGSTSAAPSGTVA